MAGLLDQRLDGSTALFIDGDLQFDSNDEFIYHEALALPALAIAQRRAPSDLQVLIIGGGDGLVAREILKSSCIASIDLVDYDPAILAIANKDLLELNQSSLLNSRVTTHVKDAWEFADELIERGASFDLIVSDLTVPATVEQARFHSIEWYNKLRRLVTSKGILAVNAVSPQATPKAYWSIFNSMLTAGLHARPYHVQIPSFSALGYGADWGFFIASLQPIASTEVSDELSLAEPTRFLKETVDVRKLFMLADELFAFQQESLPAAVGSDILLRYFNINSSLSETVGVVRDSFSLDTSNLASPPPANAGDILSPELSATLAAAIYCEQGVDATNPLGDVQPILQRVLELVPSLEKDHTSRLISEFLQQPEMFLKAIDLPGLVSRLLQRAAELPECLVAELKLLQEKLEDWAGDHLTLLSLGGRIVAVLSLAIIIGNLLYPDMAYAKGSHHAAASHSSHHAAGKSEHHAAAGKSEHHAAAAHHDEHHAAAAGGHDIHGGAQPHTGGHVAGAAAGLGGARRVGMYGNRYWNGTQWLDHRPVVIEKPIIKNSLPQRNDLSDAGAGQAGSDENAQLNADKIIDS